MSSKHKDKSHGQSTASKNATDAPKKGVVPAKNAPKKAVGLARNAAPIAPKKAAAAPAKSVAAAPKKAVASAKAVLRKDDGVEASSSSTPFIPMHRLVAFEPKARPDPVVEQKKATTVKVGEKTVRVLEGTDLSGLRVGKTRLVAKKNRKKSVLKKLILEGLAMKRSESKLVEFIPVRASSSVSVPALSSGSGEEQKAGEEGSIVPPAHDTVPPSASSPAMYTPSWMSAVPTVSEDRMRELALQKVRKPAPFESPTSHVWRTKTGCDFEVRHYVRTHLDPSLDAKVHSMLQELTRFQARLKSENVVKFTKMKRYCIGFNEIRRALNRNKLKGLIVAPNLQSFENDGSLDDVVINSVEGCLAKDLPVIFALSRHRLAKALGHEHSRLNVIGLLSVDGQNVEWKQICKESLELRNRWMLDQLERHIDVIE